MTLSLPDKYRTTQKVETGVEQVGETLSIDPKYNVRETLTSGLAQPGMEIAQQYQAQTQVPDVPGTWAEVRDTVTGELRETPQTEGLPELSLDLEAYAKDPISAIKTTAGLLISSDEEGRKNVLKEWNPDIKIEKDSKGNEIVTMPDGEQAVLNKPGFSKGDAYRLLFDAAFFAPSAMAPGAGTAASAAGRGALKKAVIGGVAAGATEAGRQKLSQALGTGEETDIGRIGMTALTGAAAEYIPAKFKARKEAKAAERIGLEKELAEEAGKKAAKADIITEKTGVGLGRAQKTGGMSDLGRMEYVAQLPAAEQKAMKFFEKQNKQAYKAVTNLMDTIAPAESVGKASRRTRKAAQDIIGGAVEERAKAARPLYKRAFKDKTLYSPEKTINYINATLKRLPKAGERKSALEKVKGFFGENQTIRQLDETKIELDGMIGKAIRDGDNRLAGNLQEVKKKLLEEVDTLNPDYKKAREIYSKKSPGIQELEESAIGTIAKKKDEQIKTVARSLFEPDKNLFDPQSVRQARTMISKQDPEAWGGIVRAEWQRRLGKARITPEDLAAGENVPGKLRSKIFGTGKERETLYAALTQEQKKNARYLEEALKKAEKGRKPGSPTAKNLSVYEKELRKGVAGGLRNFLKDIKGTVAGIGEDVAYDARTKAIADVMFDPKWKPQMSDLRKLAPTSQKARDKFIKLLGKSIAVSQSPESPAATRRALEILNKEE